MECGIPGLVKLAVVYLLKTCPRAGLKKANSEAQPLPMLPTTGRLQFKCRVQRLSCKRRAKTFWLMKAYDCLILLDDFKSVKKNHYTNVTSLKLFRRVPPKPMSTVVPVGTCNSQTPANFFKRMLSPNILEKICRGSRQRYPIVAKTGKHENIQLDSSHYLKFAVAQLSEMVTFHKSQKELRNMLSGTSLSINKYNQICSYLHPPWETIWPMVNRNFETSIIPGGYATLERLH
ncbi:hypothetical protein PROFUN_01975 [Planoprotostelium fungivorum]|uniref:Uncharacterized protein n=1 Tax=Planoprotostelium fungivorum TaxID=1890364 RepID=A0A2P6NB21_9EUKA|nr:hypothetical protein PROFUN_01975 [Planoprotostelium fungivorum]